MNIKNSFECTKELSVEAYMEKDSDDEDPDIVAEYKMVEQRVNSEAVNLSAN